MYISRRTSEITEAMGLAEAFTGASCAHESSRNHVRSRNRDTRSRPSHLLYNRAVTLPRAPTYALCACARIIHRRVRHTWENLTTHQTSARLHCNEPSSMYSKLGGLPPRAKTEPVPSICSTSSFRAALSTSIHAFFMARLLARNESVLAPSQGKSSLNRRSPTEQRTIVTRVGIVVTT